MTRYAAEHHCASLVAQLQPDDTEGVVPGETIGHMTQSSPRLRLLPTLQSEWFLPLRTVTE